MNVPWYVSYSTPVLGGLGLHTGVDFCCFSTVHRDCEALKMREDQLSSTLFVYVYDDWQKKWTKPGGEERKKKTANFTEGETRERRE